MFVSSRDWSINHISGKRKNLRTQELTHRINTYTTLGIYEPGVSAVSDKHNEQGS